VGFNNRLKATAEVKRAKRVALLHSTRGLKHLGVIVNEKRRLCVAPSSPPLQTWKHVRRGFNKCIAIHQIESILEIDLEQSHIRRVVLQKSIPQRMSHHFDSALTAHAIVLA
jgi:hypothetical protein